MTAVLFLELVYGNDSNHYIDVARTALADHQWAHYHVDLSSRTIPDRTIPWPPLFPAILAVLLRLGASNELAFRLVATASYAAASVCLFELVRKSAGSWAAYMSVAVWTLVMTTANITGYALSEPLFIAITALMLLLLSKALEGGRRELALWFAAGVAGGCAYLTRAVGLGVAPLCIGVAAVVALRTRALRPLIVAAIGFSIIALPWYLYERVLHMQSHVRGGTSLPKNVFLAAKTTFNDLLIPICLTVVMFAAAAALRDWLVHPIHHAVIPAPVIACLAWIGSYTVVLLASATVFAVDPIGTRFMSPVYPAAIAVFAFVATRSADEAGLKVSVLPAVYGQYALAVTLLAVSVVTLYGHFRDRGAGGLYPGATCIQENTPARALIIAKVGCPLRVQSGRVVLESAYPQQPAFTSEGLARFLAKWSDRFDGVYYIKQVRPDWVPPKAGEEDDDLILKSLEAWGYSATAVPASGWERVVKLTNGQ